MKKILLILLCVFLGTGVLIGQENIADDSKREEVLQSLMRFILTAPYKGVNHDGVYTMTAENVIIYSSELNKFEPFKSFENQTASTCYILNKASIISNLTPVYSINGESDPDKWPLEKIWGSVSEDKNANGYRRSGKRGSGSTTDTITYLDAEEQKKFEQKLAEEKTAAEKKRIELLDRYFFKLKNAEYLNYWDIYQNKDFLMSSKPVEIYSKEFNNLLSPSFKTEQTLKYVLNKASMENGFEAVYSVNGETNPENWNLARYKTIDENAGATGYRLAENYQKKLANQENTATAFFVVRNDSDAALQTKQKRAALGKAFLDSIGLTVNLSENQIIKLADKALGVISTDLEHYKVFSLSTEKKSLAAKQGIKDGDIFLIANGKTKNGKSTSAVTTKIFIDSETVDLSPHGGFTSLDDIYAAFENAGDAKKVSIQIIRTTKTSTSFKEFIIKK